MTANARTTVAHGNAAPHHIASLPPEHLPTLTSCLKSPSNLESRDTLHYTQRSVWCGITLGIIFLQDVLLKLRHPQAIWYTFILFLMIINCRVQCFVVSRVYRGCSSSVLGASVLSCCMLFLSTVSVGVILHFHTGTLPILPCMLFLSMLFTFFYSGDQLDFPNCSSSFHWPSSPGWWSILFFNVCLHQVCSTMPALLSISVLVFHASPCLPVALVNLHSATEIRCVPLFVAFISAA